jgi:hypothetical protein
MKKKSTVILKEPTLEAAINKLCKELKSDKGYYIGWQANIAMSYQDAAYQNKSRDSRKKLHEISNKAANYFLWLLLKD